MLQTLKTSIQKIFNCSSKSNQYGHELEAFIISKNPTCPGDVDYWARVYDQRNSGGYYGR